MGLRSALPAFLFAPPGLPVKTSVLAAAPEEVDEDGGGDCGGDDGGVFGVRRRRPLDLALPLTVPSP